MSKITFSIRIKDFGEFHGLLAKFQLQKFDDGTEQVLIKYGFKMDEGFYPCTVVPCKTINQVLLCKAGIGKLGDVKLKSNEWLKLLNGLRSVQLFNYYSELINNKVAV